VRLHISRTAGPTAAGIAQGGDDAATGVWHGADDDEDGAASHSGYMVAIEGKLPGRGPADGVRGVGGAAAKCSWTGLPLSRRAASGTSNVASSGSPTYFGAIALARVSARWASMFLADETRE